MREIAQAAVEAALNAGATYADARVVERAREQVRVKNGHVDGIVRDDSLGLGVRVIAGGAWGFSATADLSADGVSRCAHDAVRIARAGATVPGAPIELSPLDPVTADWHSRCRRDPFEVPLEDKVSLLLDIDAAMAGAADLAVREGELNAYRTTKAFANSEGSDIRQQTTECGALLQAIAVGDGEVQERSYPSALEGQHKQAGWEAIDEMYLLEGAARIGREAADLLTAPPCPSEELTVILDGSQLALQVHESCGHPIELDRVFGTELSLAGGSFLQPEKLGMQYGSEHVNIVADATVPGGLGTFAYDDEGVPAQRTPIVTEGVFEGYLSSRETAPGVGQSSQGAMRADGWENIPLIRMTNINLEPGDWTKQEMIAETRRGLLLQDTRSWSIDDLRLNFQFSTQLGWLIEDGAITGMVRNPSYQGITPEFWNTCDAVGMRKEWQMWGVLNCGKGDPIQTMHVGHGASSARFQKVRVGIT